MTSTTCCLPGLSSVASRGMEGVPEWKWGYDPGLQWVSPVRCFGHSDDTATLGICRTSLCGCSSDACAGPGACRVLSSTSTCSTSHRELLQLWPGAAAVSTRPDIVCLFLGDMDQHLFSPDRTDGRHLSGTTPLKFILVTRVY